LPGPAVAVKHSSMALLDPWEDTKAGNEGRSRETCVTEPVTI